MKCFQKVLDEKTQNDVAGLNTGTGTKLETNEEAGVKLAGKRL